MIFSSLNIYRTKYLYHASPIQNIPAITPKIAYAYPHLGEVVFASSVESFAACFGVPWDDKYVEIGVTHSENSDDPKDDKVKQVTLIIKDPSKIDLDNTPCSMYYIKGKFKYLEYVSGLEQISKKECSIINETKFRSLREMLQYYHVNITIL